MKKIVITIMTFSIAAGTAMAQMDPVEYHNVEVEKTRKYQKGNGNQKDLLLFVDMLRSSHPAFTQQMTAPVNLDSLLKADYERVKVMDEEDFTFYLQGVMSMLKDGHSLIQLFNYDWPPFYCFSLYHDDKGYN